MKKIYAFFAAALLAGTINAQCTADASLLSPTDADIFPSAQHLPHIVPDSAYNQTIQARIQQEMTMNFLGFVEVAVRVDSVRLDSIQGLPNGITWVKSPDVLYGGQVGCVQFTGTTTDTAGIYPIVPYGKIWAHLSAPTIGLDQDTSSTGRIDRIAPFRNYFLTVDSTASALTLSSDVNHLCFEDTSTGSVEIFASGGSSVEPYTYTWSTGSHSYLLSNIGPGVYDVTVTSGTETATATIEVLQQQTPITLVVTSNAGSNGNDGEAYAVASGGTPPYTYQWNKGAGTNDTATGLAPGNFRVTVRDSLGCSQSEVVTIQNLNTGISTLSGNTTVSIYPNPANSILNVSIETTSQLNATVQVTDITGRVLFTAPVTTTGRYNYSINTAAFSVGLYTLQLTAGSQSMRQKFVVTH